MLSNPAHRCIYQRWTRLTDVSQHLAECAVCSISEKSRGDVSKRHNFQWLDRPKGYELIICCAHGMIWDFFPHYLKTWQLLWQRERKGNSPHVSAGIEVISCGFYPEWNTPPQKCTTHLHWDHTGHNESPAIFQLQAATGKRASCSVAVWLTVKELPKHWGERWQSLSEEQLW